MTNEPRRHRGDAGVALYQAEPGVSRSNDIAGLFLLKASEFFR